MSNWQLSSRSLFLLFRELASRAFQLHKQVMLSACNSQSKANPCFTQKAKLVSEGSHFFLLLDPGVQVRCSTASRQEPTRASQHLGMSRGVDPRGWREEASTWKNKVQNKIEKGYLLVELSSGHRSHRLGTLWGGLKGSTEIVIWERCCRGVQGSEPGMASFAPFGKVASIPSWKFLLENCRNCTHRTLLFCTSTRARGRKHYDTQQLPSEPVAPVTLRAFPFPPGTSSPLPPPCSQTPQRVFSNHILLP